MKSTSELTNFYKELYPSLYILEKRRKKIAFLVFLNNAFVIFFLLIILFSYKKFHVHPLLVIFFTTLIIIFGTVLHNLITNKYIKEFKQLIITPIIRAIDPHLGYNSELMISQHLFERSELFKHSIDHYSGNDYVKGTIEGIPLEFSDVYAKYITIDSKGRPQDRTLFRGLFLVAEFNKHFKAKTVVLPDQAEKSFGSLIGGWLQSINFTREDLVRMDDPEFEKHFVVYGSDQIEARYILSHSMMKRILDFQKRVSHPLFISFVHNHIHVGIGTGKDLFEPVIFTSLLDNKQVIEYANTLQNTIGLVEELKLNEKLWSKE